MVNDRGAVKGLIAFVGFLVVGCTVPNPESCLDGTCTDPAFPFCDVDGKVGGTPKKCLAVSCTPSELKACRGDQAIICNGSGNDYDLVACELGCDATFGCRKCATNDQCANPAPVCDMTSASCRACTDDAECTSQVCDGGGCVAESAIVYAAPGGSESSACSRMEPCSLLRATMVAVGGGIPPIVRLLPGAYAQGLAIGVPTSVPVVVVGTGANVLAANGVQVTDGASVQIRGLAVNAATNGVVCGGAGQPRSTLTIRDAVIGAGDTFTNLVSVASCTLEMSNTELNLNSSNGSVISLSSDTSFIGDRLHVTGDGPTGIGAFGKRVGFALTNSVVEHALVLLQTSDTTDPRSSFLFGFNTFVLDSGFQVDCRPNSGTPFRRVIYDDNIIVSSNILDTVIGNSCQFSTNLIFPQSTAIPGNIAVDPAFVDAATRNYHLKTTSPAVDAGMATSSFPSVDHDLEGVMRPQGGRPDIGALEFKP